MKKLLFCLMGAFILNACSEENEALLKGGDINIGLLPEEKPNNVVQRELFDKLNLNYPGLEKVKAYHEAGQDYYACYELLKYYRNRTNVVNPMVDLINTTLIKSDQNIADQALSHRFYVRNNYEKKDPVTGQEIYYLFEDGEGRIDWNLKVDGTDQEFYYQRHRHQWMEPQAKAYRVTKDEKYVRSWVEVYSDWIDTYPCPVGVVFPQGGSNNDVDYQWKGLQVAERVLTQLNLFDYMIHSTTITPEWFSRVLNVFEQHIELMRINYIREGNILISQSQAVAFAGILMPEFKKAEEWTSEGIMKIVSELENQFLPDGVQYELDLDYHMGAIGDFLAIYDLLKVNDKLDLLPEDYFVRLNNSANFLKDIVYPDYSWECFNDTKATTKRVLTRNFGLYYSKIMPNDEEMHWMASEGKEGVEPTYLTKSYPNAGYYVLRNGWRPESLMMILKNNDNKQNKWHCQPDNGTITCYCKGRNFLPDAGCFAYSGSNREKYRATWRHNTLTQGEETIDGSHQRGELVGLKTLSDNTDVLITENKPYNGLTHRRTIFFVQKKFFVLVDEAFGETDRPEGTPSVELNFHLISDKETPTLVDRFSNKYEGGAHTNFKDGNNICIRSFAEATRRTKVEDFAFEEKQTDYSLEHNFVAGQRVGYQMAIKRRNRAMRFITVIYPCIRYSDIHSMEAYFTDNGEKDSELGHFKSNGAALKVSINGVDYDLSYNVKEQSKNN